MNIKKTTFTKATEDYIEITQRLATDILQDNVTDETKNVAKNIVTIEEDPVPVPPPPLPPTRRLITRQDFVDAFEDKWDISSNPVAGEYQKSFGYSDGTHCQLTNGNILLKGHVHGNYACEVNVNGDPILKDNGAWLEPLPPTTSAAKYLGGMLEITDGELVWNKYDSYNAPNTNHACQGKTHLETLNKEGPFKVDGAHSKSIAGNLSYAPQELKDKGISYLSGLSGTSGSVEYRYGPNLWAVNDNYTARPLMLFGAYNTPAGWEVSNKCHAIQWIETPELEGVVALVRTNLGERWYGEHTEKDAIGNIIRQSPYGGGKGYHAEGYLLELWIYRPQDLLDVFDGVKVPGEPRPVEKIPLVRKENINTPEEYFGFMDAGSTAAGATHMSFREGRLIIIQGSAYRPNRYARLPSAWVFDF